MAITYPINLLPGFPGWTTGFSLRWRQEQSTQASGRILVMEGWSRVRERGSAIIDEAANRISHREQRMKRLHIQMALWSL